MPTPRRNNSDLAVRNHFNSYVHLYTEKVEANYREICRERLELLEAHMDADADGALKILDVGCGAGTFTDMLLEKYPRARSYCVDSSLGMLKRNARCSRKSVIMGDAKALPFGPCSFDLINVDTLMHHLVDFAGYHNTLNAIQEFLVSLRGLLKPGGVLLVREIYHESLVRRNLGSYLIYRASTVHLPEAVARIVRYLGLKTANAGVCFLTRQQWNEIFARSGFKQVSVRDRHWVDRRLQMMGFRENGDLYYTLSPDVQSIDGLNGAGEVLETPVSVSA